MKGDTFKRGDIFLYYAPAESLISEEEWIVREKYIGVVWEVAWKGPEEIEPVYYTAFATGGKFYAGDITTCAEAMIKLGHVSDFGLDWR